MRWLLLALLCLAPALHADDADRGPNVPEDQQADESLAAGGAAFTAIYYSSGLELLASPTGLQPTLQVIPLRFGAAELQLYLGTHITDHRNHGLHERELGFGPGAGLGAKWWPFERSRHFFAGPGISPAILISLPRSAMNTILPPSVQPPRRTMLSVPA